MKKIGITGGIGSGKSTVCKLLNTFGYPVYITDIEAKRLSNSPEIIEKIRNKFGNDVICGDTLNRPALAQIVFADKAKLQTLNNIIHPAVSADFERWAKCQSTDLVFVESAILLQTNISSKLDKIVLVTSDKETRTMRVAKRDSLSEEQIRSRMNNQQDDEEMQKKCDFIVKNDNKTALIPQIEKLLISLK